MKGELVRCQTHLAKECVSVMLIDWGTSDVVTLQSLSHLTQELAALQPVMGRFRLRGCGHAGVKDMQGLVDKEVLMEEVETAMDSW